jgi:hypothetical protein
MKLYLYNAMLSKTMMMQGKITDTDNHVSQCMVGLPLGSEYVTGHVLAENREAAKHQAIAMLKNAYPVERHYGNHENVRVAEMEETVVEMEVSKHE